MAGNVDRAQEIIATWHTMRPLRTHFDTHWDQVRRFVNPTEPEFLTWQTQYSQGRKIHREIINNAAERSSDNFTAALHSGLCPRGVPWFELEMANRELRDNHEIAVNLAQRTEILFNVFEHPVSGFHSEINPVLQNSADYGNGSIFIDDEPGEGIIFISRPVREIYMLQDNRARLEKFARWVKMAASQAVQEYNEDSLTQDIKTAATNAETRQQQFEFVQLFEPNKNREFGRNDAANKAIIAQTVTLAGQQVVDTRGYEEMPMIAGRWSRKRNETYGRGQGMKALGDVRMLQRMEAVGLRAKEKTADPPYLLPDDGILGGKPLNLNPSAVNQVRAEWMHSRGEPIRPLLSGSQPQIADNEIERIMDRIEAMYYYDQVRLLQDPRMTATQVIALGQAVQQLLGPNMDRLELELFNPMILRVYRILQRAGAFPPGPPEMRGERIRIKYHGPIARARRAAKAEGILRTGDVATGFAAFYPQVLDNADWDSAFRDVAELFGFPIHDLRDPRAVVEIRTQRANAQAQAQQTAVAQQTAETAADVMKALPAFREAVTGEKAA